MRPVSRGLCSAALVLCVLLAIENLLVLGVLLELGVPRGAWIAAVQSSIFLLLLVALLRGGLRQRALSSKGVSHVPKS